MTSAVAGMVFVRGLVGVLVFGNSYRQSLAKSTIKKSYDWKLVRSKLGLDLRFETFLRCSYESLANCVKIMSCLSDRNGFMVNASLANPTTTGKCVGNK